MTTPEPNPNSEAADALELLLRLPAKHLENRIAQLENETRARARLRNDLQANLSSRQRQLQDRLNRLHYAQFLPNGFQMKRDCEAQIQRLAELEAREVLTCFTDLSHLTEKLQQLQEEREAESEKLRLIESGAKQETNSQILNHRADEN